MIISTLSYYRLFINHQRQIFKSPKAVLCSYRRFFYFRGSIIVLISLMSGRKIFFLKLSDFAFSQGYIVEGQILKKFFKKFQKKPEKQLIVSNSLNVHPFINLVKIGAVDINQNTEKSA